MSVIGSVLCFYASGRGGPQTRFVTSTERKNPSGMRRRAAPGCERRIRVAPRGFASIPAGRRALRDAAEEKIGERAALLCEAGAADRHSFMSVEGYLQRGVSTPPQASRERSWRGTSTAHAERRTQLPPACSAPASARTSDGPRTRRVSSPSWTERRALAHHRASQADPAPDLPRS